MRETLFLLCLLILSLVLIRGTIVWRSKRHLAHVEDSRYTQLSLAQVFTLSALLSLFLLNWFLSASITRYEVMYPVYLLGLVMVFRGVSFDRTRRRIALTLSTAVVLLQIVAVTVYFEKAGESPARFDSVVGMIPPGSRIAVTPTMWLAFVQSGRPVTLLYLGYDGRKTWSLTSPNPLQRFDAIVIDESFVDEWREYSPYAKEGRTERDFYVDGDVVHLYFPAK
jgi:hypothetical protein